MSQPRSTSVLPSILLGSILVAAYLSLFNHVGFRAEMGRGFVYVGWKEGLFWLAHVGLATPGILLVVFGLRALLAQRSSAPSAERMSTERVSTERRSLARLVAYGALLVLLSMAGREILLLGLPVTGDENVVRFGARMIAEGDLRVPTPEPADALPLHFTYRRDGMISSFDYPGGLFVTAFALASGLEGWAFALIAALGGLAVVAAGRLLDGGAGARSAAVLWLVSPMVLTLSFTDHPHLLSRSFGALGVLGWLWLALRSEPAHRRATLLVGLGTGLAAGAAFLCRPIEAACLLAPAAVHLSVLAWRRPALRPAWAATAGAWALAAGAFAAYNLAITGVPWLQARFTPELASALPTDATARDLLGTNLGFNWLMLCVWFGGPLAMLLAAAGLVRSDRQSDDRPGDRPNEPWIVGGLGSAIVLQLAVALLHFDTGIHSVGPIHYSETAVPLTLLAVLGLRRVREGTLPLRCGPGAVQALVVGLALALVVFDLTYALSLRDQARVQRMPFEALETAGVGLDGERAVVVAEPPWRLWELRGDEIETRSWVVAFPPPDPYLRDDVLFVSPTTRDGEPVTAERLRALLPERTLYRMEYRATGEPIVVRPLGPGPFETTR